METLVNTGTRSMKPSPASNHLAGAGLGTPDGARANSRAPSSGVHTPSDPVSLFCVPGELAAAGWVLPAPAAAGSVGSHRLQRTEGRPGGWGCWGEGCKARMSGRVLAPSLSPPHPWQPLCLLLWLLTPPSAWKPGPLGPGAFGFVASCCAHLWGPSAVALCFWALHHLWSQTAGWNSSCFLSVFVFSWADLSRHKCHSWTTPSVPLCVGEWYGIQVA